MPSQKKISFEEVQQELRQLQAEYRKILKKVALLEDKVSLDKVHTTLKNK